MQMLSEDDLDLRAMTWEEVERAWDLWFDLAQHTDEADPAYTHGVFLLFNEDLRPPGCPTPDDV